MARQKDPNSGGQQAFPMLDQVPDTKREDVLAVLKARYNIGDSYAATLYAAHRTIHKQNGTMAKVYSVRDVRDGKPVKPYLKVENTFNPKPDDCLTVELAKAQYLLRMKSKMATVAQL